MLYKIIAMYSSQLANLEVACFQLANPVEMEAFSKFDAYPKKFVL